MLKSLNDGEGETDGNGNADKKAISEMEQLEDLILSKVPVDEILKKMTELKHELLKLDAAKKEQGREEKRESTTNFDGFNRPKTPLNLLPESMKNYNEILIRQSLPLRQNYKKKVQEYFKKAND